MSRYRWHVVPDIAVKIILASLLVFAGCAPVTAANIEKRTSQDGTIVVPWKEGYARYQTLRINSVSGDTLSRHPVVNGQNWVITGLSDGQYRFILSSSDSQTQILSLHVSHYSLTSAFGLFTLGLIMFVYLLVALMKGGRDD
ncbi:hypothetical protein OCL06_05945 [Alteromonas sp. ASW11-19]|uniref:Uncharacterized protein n=1 Tax=Alteromonas salexigens TaxID=2982530 RepID=A0ABT2VLG2_9ALTE|nr:hypothetical protein [Alteromonas salexigens]MCU7554133.1 hypothetical protein [Alteromonas salexigens]